LIKGLGGRMFAGRGTFAFPWRNRRRTRRDDSGSMPLAMLVTLVGVTLSAGVSGMVVGQIKNSQMAANRVAAVAAAQAGLDAELANIRAAVNVTRTAGILNQLPCGSTTATLASLGGATTTTPTYQASIAYFLANPTGMVSALKPLGDLTNFYRLLPDPVSGQASSTTINGLLASLSQTVTPAITAGLDTAVQSAVNCTSGTLGSVPNALQQVPNFGLLRSVGTVGSVTRTLYATYSFRTTEDIATGGHIIVAGTNNQLCLGATDPTSAVNNYVLALPCGSAANLTTFIYPSNLSLSLSPSRTAKTSTLPYGLCITSPATPVNGAFVTLTPCSATKTPSQQWSYEVNQQTYYGTSNGTSSNNYCLSMQTPGQPGGRIVLMSGAGYCGTAGAVGRAFVPEQSVGAGGAGVNSGQLVNFQEVGRCLDLTNEDPKGKWFTDRGLAPALITYPCKQAFDGNVFWNHKWVGPTINPPQQGTDPAVYTGTGTVMTVPTNGAYKDQQWCMKSPGANGGYVWVALCSTGGPNLQWTVNQYASLFSLAYQVSDVYGNCLEAAGSLGAAYQYSGYSEVITATCNGSDIQKWNAPQNAKLSPLTGVQER
jgi:hypothetical protein